MFSVVIADYSQRLKEVIREAQVVMFDQPDVEIPFGSARWERDSVCYVMVGEELVTWIREGAKRLQARLVVRTHTGKAGDRTIYSTMPALCGFEKLRNYTSVAGSATGWCCC